MDRSTSASRIWILDGSREQGVSPWMTNSRESDVDRRIVDRRLLRKRIGAWGHAEFRAARFASRLSVFTNKRSLPFSYLRGLHFPSHSLRFILPPFWPLPHSFLPTDLPPRFSPHAPALPVSSEKKSPVSLTLSLSLSVSFLPTIAHYRRDRWDLNPPAVVVVERTWTLHGMGTWARRRCSTAKWCSSSAKLVQRSLEESLSWEAPSSSFAHLCLCDQFCEPRFYVKCNVRLDNLDYISIISLSTFKGRCKIDF